MIIGFRNPIFIPSIDIITSKFFLGLYTLITCISSTGALRICPLAALNTLLNIQPIKQFAKSLAANRTGLSYRTENNGGTTPVVECWNRHVYGLIQDA